MSGVFKSSGTLVLFPVCLKDLYFLFMLFEHGALFNFVLVNLINSVVPYIMLTDYQCLIILYVVLVGKTN